MSIIAHLALTLCAALALGLGAWLMLAAIVTAIAPRLSLSIDVPMQPYPPLLLAVVGALGLTLFMIGGASYARLAVLP